MYKMTLLAFLFLISAAGCVTLPAPVDDGLLAEKTADESSRLSAIEKSIIDKNNARPAAKKGIEESENALNIAEGRLKVLEAEKDLLEKKEKQFKIEKNENGAAGTAKEIVIKTDEIEKQGRTVDFQKALRAEARASYELLEAELSMLVARRSYERAVIARAYQDRKAEKEGVPVKKGLLGIGTKDARIDVDKYRKYLDAQQANYDRSVEKQKAASVALKESRERMK